MGDVELVVQPWVGTQVVQGPQRTGIGVGGTPHDPTDPGCPGGSGAHRAWFQGDEQGRLVEPPGSKLGGRIPQGEYLCVGRGVIGGFPLVVTAGDDPLTDGHDGTYRYLAKGSRPLGLN